MASVTSPKHQSEPILIGKKHFIPREQLVYDANHGQLGEDIGYGKVFKGTYSGKQVAIKVVKIGLKHLSPSNIALLNEIERSMNLSHENFMPYLGWSHDDDAIYIVSPFISKGSLFELLQKETLSSALKVKLAEDIIKGLSYLHENTIVHRDMKASNVMIDKDYTALVYDLGLAKLAKEREKMSPVPRPSLDFSGFASWRPSIDIALAKLTEHKSIERTKSDLIQIDSASCGKIEQILYPWMPPELTKDKYYSQTGDIYGYGCVLFELLTGKHPFAYEIETNKLELCKLWQTKEKGSKPIIPNQDALQQDPYLNALMNVMNKCLDMDETKRPTCFEILMDIRAITDNVFRVSHKVSSNCYSSLKEALYVRSLLPEQRVSIFIDPDMFHEEEDTQLNIAHTYIFGCKGSKIKGHFLTISKDHVELDNIILEGKHQDFHVNIAFCSPSIKRCQIFGGLMVFGDDNTKPVVCYNIIHNANSISTMNSNGTFKHNQFHMCPHHGKHHPAEAHGVGSGIDTLEAKSIALALGNQDVSVLELSDQSVTDAAAKYIAHSLLKCTKIVKIDFSLNNISDAGAKYIADAICKLPNLAIVDLSDNAMGYKGCKAIIDAILESGNVTLLNLSYNHIGKDGAKYLCKLFESNAKITKLDISYNKLGDSGVLAVLDALEQNTTLKQLGIGHNECSDKVLMKIDEFCAKKPHMQVY